MANDVALLSVRPRFATALLDGSKTVEIRRRRAHIADGATGLVYSSAPVSSLVGAIRVKTTENSDLDTLWQRWGAYTGLSRAEYETYLAGITQPCAIIISQAVAFSQPVTLPELRLRRHAFVAPQSYRFLDRDELSEVLNGEARQLKHLVNASDDSTGLPQRRSRHAALDRSAVQL